MKRFINFVSLAIVLCTVASLVACKDNNKEPESYTVNSTTTVVTKNTTSVPAVIDELPESTEDRVEMLNSALDYIELYCYKYTKNVKCSVSDLSIGSLSKASNAYDAFKSIFGECDTTADYSYEKAPESFAENIASGDFSVDDVISADIKREGDDVILEVKFKNETSPDDKSGVLHLISPEYMNSDKVKKNLGDFNSSASSINVSASDIKLTATISAKDSSLKKLVAEYSENFSLGSVVLVNLEGSSVTGKSKTVITYSNIG